jgi:hypothetical protein
MNSALLDAGHSAFWFQGKSQHIKVEGNRIERPVSRENGICF